VTMALTNAMSDRAVTLPIATDGDIDFSFAVPLANSKGLSVYWDGNCNSAPVPSGGGLCYDAATRVATTTPSHVDELEPKIPAGGTVTMNLYSSAIPTSLAIDKLQLVFLQPETGKQILIPIPG
jgi:hypothetical protein